MSNTPISVFDVAKYIVRKLRGVTAMKLQKLVYYSQAWAGLWLGHPLFREPIEAWISGPVVDSLYQEHKGKYIITEQDLSKGDPNKVVGEYKETVDKVLAYYGDKNSQELSDLTHAEYPWQKARKGLTPNERGSNEITLASMEEYYSSLTQ